MALGEKIKACRQRKGMSQEKVAERVGVSRQAVTKWEMNQSAPNTENLFKLAGIFDTTVDALLACEDETKKSPAEQVHSPCKSEAEKKIAMEKRTRKRNLRTALIVAFGYMGIYLIGRLIWCDLSQSSLIGWLFTASPSGKHSYLYGWLLSSGLFWYTMTISVIPAFFGRYKFSYVTLTGFVMGLAAGMLFGPNPEGAARGQGHYGWAIWGAICLISIVAGLAAEKCKKKSGRRPPV